MAAASDRKFRDLLRAQDPSCDQIVLGSCLLRFKKRSLFIDIQGRIRANLLAFAFKFSQANEMQREFKKFLAPAFARIRSETRTRAVIHSENLNAEMRLYAVVRKTERPCFRGRVNFPNEFRDLPNFSVRIFERNSAGWEGFRLPE